MFEQSLYEQEPVAQPLQDGDLFGTYEIKSWSISPRLYKILGASVVVNLLALLVFAQTSLLTMKGCDSPLVGSVCQVLDTVYVGAMLFGTDREYVDADYEKTDLGEADITYIEVAPESAKLSYPEGYFAIANPVQYQQMLDSQNSTANLAPGFLAPGIPSSNPIGIPPTTRPYIPGRSVFDTKANPPKRRDNVVNDEDLPTEFENSGTSENGTVTKPRGSRNGKVDRPGKNISGTSPETNAGAEPKKPEASPTNPVDPAQINPRVFKDLAKAVSEIIAAKNIDLQKSQFEVEATGKLNKDGKLEKKTFRFIKATASDPEVVEIVKQSIEAFNDSGFLSYLKALSGKDLNFSIKQDQEKISAVVRSELDRDSLANSIAGILKLGADYTKNKKKKAIEDMQAANDPAKAADLQNEIDDLELLNNTVISSYGKSLIITFNAQNGVIHPMLQRKLEEQTIERAKLSKKS